MIRVKYTIDSTGVSMAWRQFHESIMGINRMGKILGGDVGLLWVSNIRERLTTPQVDTARSDWRHDEDMGFDRKNYTPGGTNKIANAITASMPMKLANGNLYLGIGNIADLSSAAKLSEEADSGYALWAVLEWGTGIFSTFKETPALADKTVKHDVIIRHGFQVFPDRDTWEQVIIYQGKDFGWAPPFTTKNPGQMGRHYFLALDGSFYASDIQTTFKIFDYIARQVREYSYK